MKKSFLILILAMIALGMISLSADEKTPQPKKEAPAKDNKPPEPKGKQEFPPMENFIKDFRKLEGFYTLFHKEEKLYALIKPSQLNQLFLLAASVSGGPEFTGWQWIENVVKWEKVEKNLLLVCPNLKHRTDKPSSITEVVKKTYTDSVIHAVPILSMDPGGNILIDFNQVFKTDISRVGLLVSWIVDGGGGINPMLSSWTKIKVFPENVELEVKASFLGGGFGSDSWNPNSQGLVADGRGVRMNIHYSLSLLPKTDYKPRLADDRVGYFLTAYKDYSKPYDSKTQFVRYIHRWNLEKADPEVEMSPPKSPIIFYIEKTVPIRFRHYIKEGILEWNKAFEKIGIVDAIIVRQQTDKEFADIDPEDVRYNFFRWITSGSPYAMGPSRANPFTGQILDADIVFDDSFIRYLTSNYQLWGPEALSTFIDQKTYEKISNFPVWKQLFEKNAGEYFLGKNEDAWKQFYSHPARKEIGENPYQHCQHAAGMSYQLAMASLIFELRDQEGKIPEKYMGLVVKELSTHEVGHTLGLRHNFKGSTWLKLSDINRKENPPAITSGSIMDYNPVNIAPKGTPQGNYQTAGLGPYDYWAIEYGYGFPQKGENDEKMLQRLAEKSTAPELAYGTDEDASFSNPDPLVLRWDQGSDLLEFAKNRYTLFLELKQDLMEKTVKKGESYSLARRGFNLMMWNYLYSSIVATRYVGGEYFHRNHKGDPNEKAPFVVVDVKKQREALDFLSQELLSGKNFQFSPEFLNRLAPGRWLHWGSDSFNRGPYPIHDSILATQMIPVIFMMAPWTLERIHDMELQVPADQDAITVAEVVESLVKSIFAELDQKEIDKKTYSNRQPFISSSRRMLQNEFLGFLLFIRNEGIGRLFYNGNIQSIVTFHLDKLLKRMDEISVLEKLDSYSAAHITSSKRLIEKALYGEKGRSGK